MAVSYVNSITATSGSIRVTFLNCNVPVGAQAGDLIVRITMATSNPSTASIYNSITGINRSMPQLGYSLSGYPRIMVTSTVMRTGDTYTTQNWSPTCTAIAMVIAFRGQQGARLGSAVYNTNQTTLVNTLLQPLTPESYCLTVGGHYRTAAPAADLNCDKSLICGASSTYSTSSQLCYLAGEFRADTSDPGNATWTRANIAPNWSYANALSFTIDALAGIPGSLMTLGVGG